jgi:hypothetical protein
MDEKIGKNNLYPILQLFGKSKNVKKFVPVLYRKKISSAVA